jgi:hypothetical protein
MLLYFTSVKAIVPLAVRFNPVVLGDALTNLTLPLPLAGIPPVSTVKIVARELSFSEPVINQVYGILGFNVSCSVSRFVGFTPFVV